MKSINIADVRINGGTQSRAAIDRAVVAEYADAVKAGATFPPIVVFFDGGAYWLADGFHRYEAYARAGIHDVPADIHQGTQRDAILFSVGANAAHGLRRTNDDKRRAVSTLLNDPEWAKWSDREIARQCGVTHPFVAGLRAPKKTSEPAPSGNGYHPEKSETAENSHFTVPEDAPSPPPQAAPEPEPTAPIDPERRKIARMNPEAMIDEIIGLRADLKDAKAKAAALQAERDDLKAKLNEATASDQGAVISSLQKQLRAAKHARDEAMSATKRMEYQLKKAEKRVRELEDDPIELGAV